MFSVHVLPRPHLCLQVPWVHRDRGPLEMNKNNSRVLPRLFKVCLGLLNLGILSGPEYVPSVSNGKCATVSYFIIEHNRSGGE